jgi:hypothetical protein
MRSIPIAMIWELLNRGRWQLLLGFIGGNAMPLLILTALKFEGEIDPDEPALITMQMMLLLMHTFIFGAAILSAVEFAPRAYVLPARTSTLVVWKMVPAMILITLDMIVSIAGLNLLFGMKWSITCAAALAPVGMALIMAALWFAERSPWLPVVVGTAGGVLGLWYKSRWGPMFSMPQYAWTVVTPADAAVLILFTALAFVVAVVGVSRNRRGDTIHNLSGIAWAHWWAGDRAAQPLKSFGSPAEAQYWAEWTTKGWMLPFVVMISLVVGSMIFLPLERDPKVIIKALIGAGGMLSAIGIVCGFLAGNCGSNDANTEFGQFLGTRPLTDLQIGQTILKVVLKSVLISWSIWAAFAVTVLGLIQVTVGLPQMDPDFFWPWWGLPATLLGCWIVAAGFASLTLSGRTQLWALVFCIVITMMVIFSLVTKVLPRETQMMLFAMVQALIGIGLTGITVWCLTTARQRSLIAGRMVLAAGCIWLGLTAVIIVEGLRVSYSTLPATIFLIGLASLTITPLAAAPLAVAANRHR